MENKTMMQYFEWYLPSNGLFWERCAAQAEHLKEAGIDMLWLPPAYKGAAGSKSVGYDVYDTYDLGEFDQKGSVATKYGTREEYLAAVKKLQEHGTEVLTDVVLNHMQFVDNHDTQSGQALYSFIPTWFKPIAYAIILLRRESMPCVFYGDYYGIPHDHVAPVPELKKLLKLRKCYAYGEQRDYFDDASVVGFTRSGDSEHPDSGMAVLITDSVAGKKWMQVGEAHAGSKFYDVMCRYTEPVVLDSSGAGEFKVDGGSVSIWVSEAVYRRIRTEVE